MKRIALALGICLASQPAAATDWARSAAPFWRPGAATEQQNCSHADGIVQCYGFRLGNWKRRDPGCDPGPRECGAWIELNFVGLFLSGFAYIEKADPGDYGISHRSYIRTLAPDLYAIEMGYEGGARYLVLSAAKGGKPIEHASVMDLRCENASGGYCTAAGPDDLARMAHEALGRKPLATFDWIDDGVTGVK
jgi:hypothetical protein